MKRILHFSFFSLILLSLACESDKTAEPADLGYDYFPTDVGQWVIYQVEEIIKDDFTGMTDSLNYQIMEVIDSNFFDNQGRLTQRLERYRRDNASQVWVIDKVWVSNRTNTLAEKVEDNIRFVKLAFPPETGKRWDGNASNVIDRQDYAYTEVDAPEMISGLNFISTLEVKQKDDDFINKRELDTERYARGVGLIHRSILDLDICFKCGSNNEDTIDAAYIYIETIIDYGSN